MIWASLAVLVLAPTCVFLACSTRDWVNALLWELAAVASITAGVTLGIAAAFA